MTEAFRSPGPAVAATTSPGSLSKFWAWWPGPVSAIIVPWWDAVPGSVMWGAPGRHRGRHSASGVLLDSAPMLWLGGWGLVGPQLGEEGETTANRES